MSTFIARGTRTAAIVAVLLAGSSLATAQVYGVTPFPAQVGPPLQNAPIGGLQLAVEPRSAQVYVDGTYVGVVSDFSGYYKHLDIVAGLHLITILAPNYDPLIISVMVVPGQTVTYRGSLTRAYGW